MRATFSCLSMTASVLPRLVVALNLDHQLISLSCLPLSPYLSLISLFLLGTSTPASTSSLSDFRPLCAFRHFVIALTAQQLQSIHD
ncbi:hypothetical protein IWZ00DRAFT_342533 [Phyllosticta capitalensis]